jgi:hypothetical protein
VRIEVQALPWATYSARISRQDFNMRWAGGAASPARHRTCW